MARRGLVMTGLHRVDTPPTQIKEMKAQHQQQQLDYLAKRFPDQEAVTRARVLPPPSPCAKRIPTLECPKRALVLCLR